MVVSTQPEGTHAEALFDHHSPGHGGASHADRRGAASDAPAGARSGIGCARRHVLLPSVREFLADFGPTLAIASMAGIAYFARDVTPLTPLPAPDRASAVLGDMPNAGRPLTHDEFLMLRGEMGDPDQSITVVVDTAIERKPARDSEHGPVMGTLPRDAYPGDPAVEASPLAPRGA